MARKRRIALVTGGVQRLGAAAAPPLAEAEVTVAAAHLGRGGRAEAFGQETGMPVFEWNASEVDACARRVAEVEQATGPLDRRPADREGQGRAGPDRPGRASG